MFCIGSFKKKFIGVHIYKCTNFSFTQSASSHAWPMPRSSKPIPSSTRNCRSTGQNCATCANAVCSSSKSLDLHSTHTITISSGRRRTNSSICRISSTTCVASVALIPLIANGQSSNIDCNAIHSCWLCAISSPDRISIRSPVPLISPFHCTINHHRGHWTKIVPTNHIQFDTIACRWL